MMNVKRTDMITKETMWLISNYDNYHFCGYGNMEIYLQLKTMNIVTGSNDQIWNYKVIFSIVMGKRL